MIGEDLNTNTMTKYLFQQAHKQFTVKKVVIAVD